MIQYVAKKIVKNKIEKQIAQFRDDDELSLAKVIVTVFSTSECRLLPTPEQFEMFQKDGLTDEQIEDITVCPYHYLKGSHTLFKPLMDYALRDRNTGLYMGLSVHYYTSLSVFYPDLESLMKELWEAMFQGENHVKKAFSSIWGGKNEGERVYLKTEDFLQDPRKLTPHFWIPDHPVTKKVKDLQKFWEKRK